MTHLTFAEFEKLAEIEEAEARYPQYRAIGLGCREVDGIAVPSGTRIERKATPDGQWVYVDQVHPDDAEQYLKALRTTEPKTKL